MSDTTVTKVDSRYSPVGKMGQRYLASGTRTGMRLWTEQPGDEKPESARDYETVGYVIAGAAELYIGGQKLLLEAGDSWVVPRGAPHRYRILMPFEAIEATSPPAFVHGRDEQDAESEIETGEAVADEAAQEPSERAMMERALYDL